ncbi:F-box/kelch-repeat protein At3g06240-like [Papaver somniferum]|uniref:F-box/kelch-repeat protein At3g06240-like n=1 Tax=Papaver somniferum TaxID=3469 RepID=UPI000E6FB00B|nr:F-box/kelch-repeat protein At3g06240-like [Papaver somniferum]XP_026395666.1 F-box/kelch-repeat protein At3g06240-like [Papaver somniferum]
MPTILGSSNGLVLIVIAVKSSEIFAFGTRLPANTADSGDSDAHGFGFDCKNDDYKVIRIESSDPNEEVSEASVYSLASNSWKELGIIPYHFPLGINKGFLLNGVLYWIATGILSEVLVCFDISDEMFRDVPLPYNSLDEAEAPSFLDLGVWEGKLCLFIKNHMENSTICTHQNDHVDVWTMTDNKWSKHLNISAHMTDMYYGRPIQTLQNGEILIEGGPRKEEEGIGFISYDPQLERVRALKIHGDPDEYDVDTYIETLVPLNSGTYVNKTRKKAKTKRKKKTDTDD